MAELLLAERSVVDSSLRVHHHRDLDEGPMTAGGTEHLTRTHGGSVRETSWFNTTSIMEKQVQYGS